MDIPQQVLERLLRDLGAAAADRWGCAYLDEPAARRVLQQAYIQGFEAGRARGHAQGVGDGREAEQVALKKAAEQLDERLRKGADRIHVAAATAAMEVMSEGREDLADTIAEGIASQLEEQGIDPSSVYPVAKYGGEIESDEVEVEKIEMGKIEPFAQCGICGRKIWNEFYGDQMCLVLQPSGAPCPGRLVRL